MISPGTGNLMPKRDIHIGDDSSGSNNNNADAINQMVLSVWYKFAEESENLQEGDIIVGRGAQLNEFKGKLSILK